MFSRDSNSTYNLWPIDGEEVHDSHKNRITSLKDRICPFVDYLICPSKDLTELLKIKGDSQRAILRKELLRGPSRFLPGFVYKFAIFVKGEKYLISDEDGVKLLNFIELRLKNLP